MDLKEAYEIVKKNCGHTDYFSVTCEIDSLGSEYSIYDSHLVFEGVFTRSLTSLHQCVTDYLNKLETLKLSA